MKTFKLILLALVFHSSISCDDQIDENVIYEPSNLESDTFGDPNIPKEAVDQLYEMILSGFFDKEIESSVNHKAVGDGKYNGDIDFDFNTREIILKGVKTGELCPNQLIRGDREFGGGPLIVSTVSLYYFNPYVFAYVTFNARETKADRSEVNLSQWVFLNSGIKDVEGITTETYDYLSYRGINAGPEIFGCNDGTPQFNIGKYGLVKRFDIIGDTGGNDISDDLNCGCDTKIRNIELNEIRFKL